MPALLTPTRPTVILGHTAQRGGGREINPLIVRLAQLLDEAFVIPGTSARVGLDAVIGLFPVVGDLVTVAFGFLMLQEAKRLGVPPVTRARMAGNYLLDLVGGVVPVVGDVWDAAFKANKRNLKLIQKHLDKLKA